MHDATCARRRCRGFWADRRWAAPLAWAWSRSSTPERLVRSGMRRGVRGGVNPGIRFATFRLQPECLDDFAGRAQLRLRKGDPLVIVNQTAVSKQNRRFFPKGKLVVRAVAKFPLEETIAPAQAFVRREIGG